MDKKEFVARSIEEQNKQAAHLLTASMVNQQMANQLLDFQERQERAKPLIERAHVLLTDALFTNKFGTFCMCCSGHMEGDEQAHSFVHHPYCPMLLISDFARLLA